jgi:hypothetical protein
MMVDLEWEGTERSFVTDYLERGHLVRDFMGASPCRICGKPNGSAELTDGTYIWPSGLSHYTSEHSVRLPEEFIRHAYRRIEELESAGVDRSWWVYYAKTLHQA